MIPPLLEKAILKGWATYSKFTHAFGMFGGIKVPEGKIMIIVDIKWHHFLNPIGNAGSISFGNFYKYNEYQLKIDGKKSVNTLTFRNTVRFQRLNLSASYDVNINNAVGTFYDGYMWFADPPILQDVYFICEKYIKLTVSRNAYVASTVSNYGLLAAPANEKNAPSGVKNIKLTKRLTMSVGGHTQYYTPPNNEDAGLAIPGGRSYENYEQDIDPVDAFGNSNSEIYAPDTGFTATLNLPTITQPMVELGIIIINNDDFNQLANT